MTTPLTVTSTAVVNGSAHRQVYVTVLAPATPTQATNTTIYDPTTTPYTTSGAYVGTKIRSVSVTSSCQGASGTQAAISLVWDASTPVVACSIPVNSSTVLLDAFGTYCPLPNTGGSGVSGKIGLTTLGLVAGDTITILLDLING